MGVPKVLLEELFFKNSGVLKWNMVYFSPNNNEVEIYSVENSDPSYQGASVQFVQIQTLSNTQNESLATK